MGKKTAFPRGNEGMALLLATIFTALALLTVAALSARYLQQRVDADAYQDYNKAFDALEAAVARSKVQMENQAGNGTIGLQGWTPQYNEDNELVLPPFDATVSRPAAVPADPGETACPPPEYMAFTVDWANDDRDNNGDGVVNDPRERMMFSIHAAAKHRNITRRAEAVYRAINVNVWQNAIFAGAGTAAGVIQGNVDVHGSVHILGDDLVVGGVALEDAIDLSGTSLIGNNYEGIPAYLLARVPPLPTVDIEGTEAETLDAKLRVKNGLVGLNGNSHIGQPYTQGSTIKQQMDGTYVNDGWTGNQTTDNGARGIPSSVFSDNGWDILYDLGDKVTFPLLSDPWRQPNDGSFVFRAGTTPFSHEEFFTEVLLASPTNPTDGIYTGNVVLDVSAADKTGAFYWNASTNTKIVGTSAVTASPGANDDFIKFVPSQRLLTFNGQIRINGTLAFAGKGNADTINYSGRCAFLTTGDVNIDTKLLTCRNGVVTDYANTFPAQNCLGIMTKTNINLGTGNGASQLDLMGGFYAENTITSAKQTYVMGTFVSKFFNITKNVPAIFQVPDLAINLPLGMIGNYPIMTFAQQSWRELGLG